MLLELTEMSAALDMCGVKIQPKHDFIKDVDNKCIIVRIDGSGNIVEVGLHPSPLWRVEKNLHNLFPKFKVELPILKPPLNWIETKKDASWMASAAATWDFADDYSDIRASKVPDRRIDFWGRWVEYPSRLLSEMQTVSSCPVPFIDLLTVLSQQGPYTPGKAEAVLRRMVAEIANAVISGDMEDNAQVRSLFRGAKSQMRIFVDRQDNTVTKPDVRDGVSQAFIDIDNAEIATSGEKVATCSLTGRPIMVLKDKYTAKANLPYVGSAILFSVNKDRPCLTRYGMSGADAFKVSPSFMTEMKLKLEFMTGGDFKGKTWTAVPGKCKRKGPKMAIENDLLIAYLEGKPTVNVPLTHAVAMVEDSNEFMEETEKIFSMLAQHNVTLNESLRFFIIRRIDDGRHQIPFTERKTLADMQNAIAEWKDGILNVPSLLVPIADKGPLQWLSPSSLTPRDIVYVLSHNMSSSGGEWHREMEKGSRMTMVEAFDLFLNRAGSRRIAEIMLSMLIRNYAGFLVATGDDIRRIFGLRSLGFPSNVMPSWTRKHSLDVVSLMGILLYKLGRKKEQYMNGTAYNLGRFIALVDDLHIAYCIRVRGEKIASQLMGNAAIQSFWQNPQKAFGVFVSARLVPYLNWAKKADNGKSIPLLAKIEEVVGKIKVEELSNGPMKDMERTEFSQGLLMRKDL
jgi:hypothetical protein